MTLDDILNRLIADGYEGCHMVRWSPKSIIIPNLGEVELAYGEAKLFDKKHPWPEYGDHQCFKNIDDLFADIHATWPLTPAIELIDIIEETPCENSSAESLPSSPSLVDVEETVTKDVALALATVAANDSEADEQGSVQAGVETPPVCVGVDDEPRAASGS